MCIHKAADVRRFAMCAIFFFFLHPTSLSTTDRNVRVVAHKAGKATECNQSDESNERVANRVEQCTGARSIQNAKADAICKWIEYVFERARCLCAYVLCRAVDAIDACLKAVFAVLPRVCAFVFAQKLVHESGLQSAKSTFMICMFFLRR